MILAARWATLEVRKHTGHLGIGVGAAHLELDEAIEMLEAHLAGQLGTLGAKHAPSLDAMMALVAADMNGVNAVILDRMQSKVALIEMSLPQMGPALERGTVAAAEIFEPALTVARLAARGPSGASTMRSRRNSIRTFG